MQMTREEVGRVGQEILTKVPHAELKWTKHGGGGCLLERIAQHFGEDHFNSLKVLTYAEMGLLYGLNDHAQENPILAPLLLGTLAYNALGSLGTPR